MTGPDGSLSELLVRLARDVSSVATDARTTLGARLHATLVTVLPDLHTDQDLVHDDAEAT